MMRQTYWSCSKFADWLRGTPKPASASMEDWDAWHNSAKTAHPYREWLAEEGLNKLQGMLYWPVDALYGTKYYIKNRWVSKTHGLTSANLARGQWHDLGSRFVPCLFSELVDFVEIEQAWMFVAFDVEARTKFRAPWYAMGWFKTGTWRNPAAGVECLQWAASLTNIDFVDPSDARYGEPTPQAIAANEILALYNWYTAREKRPDPREASGWNEFCIARGITFHSKFSEQERAILDLSSKIEQQYEDEDTEMLVRLMKIRNHLWT